MKDRKYEKQRECNLILMHFYNVFCFDRFNFMTRHMYTVHSVTYDVITALCTLVVTELLLMFMNILQPLAPTSNFQPIKLNVTLLKFIYAIHTSIDPILYSYGDIEKWHSYAIVLYVHFIFIACAETVFMCACEMAKVLFILLREN